MRGESAGGTSRTRRPVRAGTTVGAEIRHLQVNGLRTRVALTGSGRPLLLLGGIGTGLEMWSRLGRHLDGFNVISVDLPGTGGSQAARFPLGIAQIAAQVVAVLDQLGIARVDVLGISYGGVVAQQLAHDTPERVNHLVLAATVPGLGGIAGDPFAFIGTLLPLLRSRACEAELSTPRQPSTRSGLGGSSRAVPSIRGLASQLAGLAGWSSLPWLHTIPHRTLVLTCRTDRIAPALNSWLMAHRLPKAELKILSSGGHLFMLEQPDDVASIVVEFLMRRDTVHRSGSSHVAREDPGDAPRWPSSPGLTIVGGRKGGAGSRRRARVRPDTAIPWRPLVERTE